MLKTVHLMGLMGLASGLALLLSTTACKKEAAPTVGGSGASSPPPATATPPADATATPPADATAATPARPAEFQAFEALLLPLVAEPEGETRSKKTCAQLEPLRIASLAVRRATPTGADAAAWEQASDDMRGAFEGLGSLCGDDSPDDSTDLKTIHQAYLQLLAQLPQ
ncbi:MAG: hypothetical protein R3B48_06795 [Kofleriaceae bacterium]